MHPSKQTPVSFSLVKLIKAVLCVQGLAFLPKTECNVRDVEIAVGLMLTKTTVEPVAFRVPRVKVSQLHHLVDAYRNTIHLFPHISV